MKIRVVNGRRITATVTFEPADPGWLEPSLDAIEEAAIEDYLLSGVGSGSIRVTHERSRASTIMNIEVTDDYLA